MQKSCSSTSLPLLNRDDLLLGVSKDRSLLFNKGREEEEHFNPFSYDDMHPMWDFRQSSQHLNLFNKNTKFFTNAHLWKTFSTGGHIGNSRLLLKSLPILYKTCTKANHFKIILLIINWQVRSNWDYLNTRHTYQGCYIFLNSWWPTRKTGNYGLLCSHLVTITLHHPIFIHWLRQ